MRSGVEDVFTFLAFEAFSRPLFLELRRRFRGLLETKVALPFSSAGSKMIVEVSVAAVELLRTEGEGAIELGLLKREDD